MNGSPISDIHSNRLDRVESELGIMTRDMGALKADVQGLGLVLGRIEQGVIRAQETADSRETASRPNVTAIISVLITIISILVGGAWMVSGQLAANNERADWMRERTNYQQERFLNLEARVNALARQNGGMSGNANTQATIQSQLRDPRMGPDPEQSH